MGTARVRSGAAAAALALGLVGAGAAAPRPAQAAAGRLLCNVAVPMSDGVQLSANVALPAATGRHPTILTVTPYGKNGSTPPLTGCTDPSTGDLDLTGAGYAVVIVDERGTGNSQGTADLSGPSVVRDGEDILDWIQAQPWSNGKVGNIGCSALGMSTLYTLQGEQQRLAEGKPKAIYASWADSPPAYDQYRDVSYDPGGAGSGAISILAPALIYEGTGSNNPTDPAQLKAIIDQAPGASAYAQYALDFQTDGPLAYDQPFWQDRKFEPAAASVKTPVMITAASYDLVAIQKAAVDTWMGLTHSAKRVLLYSPGYHCAPTHQDTLGHGSRAQLVKAWFDHYLQGTRNGIQDLPDVSFFPINGTGWDHYASFPVPHTRYVSYYLGDGPTGTSRSLHDGSLTTLPPTDAGADQTPYLPPVTGQCSNSAIANATGIVVPPFCSTDNRAAEVSDLTYTSAPLATTTKIAGLITADIWAELNRTDGTVDATVTDVHPDGTSQPLETGWLRATNRAVDPARSLIVPGGLDVEPYHPDTLAAKRAVPVGLAQEYEVQINPTSAVLAAGDRIRVDISATDAGVLPSASQIAAMAGETMTVVHGPQHRSRIILPLVDTAVGGATSPPRSGSTKSGAGRAGGPGRVAAPTRALAATGGPGWTAGAGLVLLLGGAALLRRRRRV